MKNKQGLTIARLIIAIVGLSIGFAAFSNTLTISSTASVNPTNTMRVVFSKSATTEVTGAANSVLPDSLTYGDGATIDNSEAQNSTLKDLHAKFTAPGQSVTYNTDLYVTNVGNYKAQLTGITFNNATGSNTYKKCVAAEVQTAGDEATSSLVDAACEGITISVTIGNATVNPTSQDKTLNHQIINVGSGLQASVTISYASGSAYVDGPMEVTFGNIVISATSAVDENLIPLDQRPIQSGQPFTSGLLVDTNGAIIKYVGNETSISIPATAPSYVESATKSVDVDACVAMGASQSDCQNMSEQYDNGTMDSNMVEAYEQVGLIHGEYVTSGNRVPVTSINLGVFQNTSIESVDFNNASNLESIGDYAFNVSNLTGILDLSGATSLTTIGKQAFEEMSITQVILPYSVTTINSYAFADNPLTTVTIGDSTNGSNISSIAVSAFDPHHNPSNTNPDLTSVTIYRSSDGVSVGSSAFGNYDISGSWHPVS